MFRPLVLGQPFHPQDRWPWVLFLEPGSGAQLLSQSPFYGFSHLYSPEMAAYQLVGPLGSTRPKKGQVGTLSMDVEDALRMRDMNPILSAGRKIFFLLGRHVPEGEAPILFFQKSQVTSLGIPCLW